MLRPWRRKGSEVVRAGEDAPAEAADTGAGAVEAHNQLTFEQQLQAALAVATGDMDVAAVNQENRPEAIAFAHLLNDERVLDKFEVDQAIVHRAAEAFVRHLTDAQTGRGSDAVEATSKISKVTAGDKNSVACVMRLTCDTDDGGAGELSAEVIISDFDQTPRVNGHIKYAFSDTKRFTGQDAEHYVLATKSGNTLPPVAKPRPWPVGDPPRGFARIVELPSLDAGLVELEED